MEVTGSIIAKFSQSWRAPRSPWGWIAAIGLYGLLALLPPLRPAPQWGDDYAGYLLQARGVVEGIPISELGYVAHPDAVEVGPQAYPMGYPLLLSPVVALVGVESEALTWWAILLTSVAGLALFAWLRRLLGADAPALLISVITSTSPVIWIAMRHIVETDVPFLALLALGWALISNPTPKTEGWQTSLVVGLYFGLLCSFRSVGVLFFAGYGLASCWAAREQLAERNLTTWLRNGRAWAITLLAWLGPQVVVHYIWPTGSAGSYYTIFKLFRHDTLPTNLGFYLADLGHYVWREPLFTGAHMVLGASLVAATVWAVRKWPDLSPRWIALGIMLYGAMILFWPPQQPDRFVLPVAVWLLSVTSVGLVRWQSARPFRAGLLLILFGTLPWCQIALKKIFKQAQVEASHIHPPPAGSVDADSTIQNNPTRQVTDVPLSPHMRECWQWIARNLPDSAVIEFAKPRAAALYTHKSWFAITDTASEASIVRQLAALRATHVLIHPELSSWALQQHLSQEQKSGRASLIWTNGRNKLYVVANHKPSD
jgi:hypothetical protein